ncbi:MAG: hypothetical protein GX442_24180 [Candidatus Riflebacteria bacterium]|nr:hypothetical protein [Candidatus Riflebacteria bacterium]
MKKLVLLSALIVFLLPALALAQDLISLLPSGGMAIGAINVARILAVPDMKKLVEERLAASRAAGGEAKALDDLARTLQFDPLKDLKEVVLLMPGPGPDGQPPTDGLAIFRGTFQEATIVAGLEKDEAFKIDGKIEKFEGLTAIRAEGKPDFGLFLAPDTLAVGNETWLRKVLAVKAGKEKGAKDDPVMGRLLQRVKTDAGYWGAVALPPSLQDQMARNASGTPFAAFGAMSEVLMAVDLGTDLEVKVSLGTDKPESAGRIAETLQGLLASIKVNGAGMPPDALKVLNAITLKAEGPVAEVGMKVNFAELQASAKGLAEAFPSPLGGAGEPQGEPEGGPGPGSAAPDAGGPAGVSPADGAPTQPATGDEADSDEEVDEGEDAAAGE